MSKLKNIFLQGRAILFLTKILRRYDNAILLLGRAFSFDSLHDSSGDMKILEGISASFFRRTERHPEVIPA